MFVPSLSKLALVVKENITGVGDSYNTTHSTRQLDTFNIRSDTILCGILTNFTMAKLWNSLKDMYISQQAALTQRRKTPRMATLAMEVLAESREEAKDLVYYDALKRVTESTKVCFICLCH